MEKEMATKEVHAEAEAIQEPPPVDFIRTPVSASDQLDIHMMAGVGGVVDFDLDDEDEEDEDEGISDNDDSDDTAPAVEEMPKRDYTYCETENEELHARDPWTWPPHLDDIGLTRSAAVASAPKRTDLRPSLMPNVPFKKPWHMQMLDSLIGTPCNSPASYPGGAMTYEEAIRSSGNRRRPRRFSGRADAAPRGAGIH